MKTADKLIVISKVLKKRFANLTVDETLKLASDVLSSIEEHIE